MGRGEEKVHDDKTGKGDVEAKVRKDDKDATEDGRAGAEVVALDQHPAEVAVDVIPA